MVKKIVAAIALAVMLCQATPAVSAERCVRGDGVTVRIHYKGKDVAKSGPFGTDVLKSRP